MIVEELVTLLKADDRQFTQVMKSAPTTATRAAQEIARSMTQAAKGTDTVSAAVNKAVIATRAWAAAKIGSDKIAEINKLGVSTRDYLDAVTGVPGAQEKVRAALKSSGTEAERLAAAYDDLDSNTVEVSKRMSSLGEIAEKSGTGTKLARTAADDLADTLDKSTGAVTRNTRDNLVLAAGKRWEGVVYLRYIGEHGEFKEEA